jgi:hypothetical protein
VPEETREAKWVEAVVTELVRACRVLVQELPEPIGATHGCRFEDIERRVGGQELVDAISIASIDSLQ